MSEILSEFISLNIMINFRRDHMGSITELNFLKFSEDQQINIVRGLLHHMSHCQLNQIDAYLKSMLQRDFITELSAKGLFQVSEQILSYLDAKSLRAANQVSHSWRQIITEGYLWKKLIEHFVTTNPLWCGLGERRRWIKKLRIPGKHIYPKYPRSHMFKRVLDSSRSLNFEVDSYTSIVPQCIKPGYELMEPEYYRRLYQEIIVDIERIQKNWVTGKYNLKKIECHGESIKGVYCLQYDNEKIVSGLRDNSIKIWDARTLECVSILTGHTGSVLCLQYDNNVIISGSSDSTIRVWSLSSLTCVNIIYKHFDAVLQLKFGNNMLVTCSKDHSIVVWHMFAPDNIRLKKVLIGHQAAVNAVDFDQKYIVSASGDRTIKVWKTQSGEYFRTMRGHSRGIACLQYRDNLVVSGSSDNTIRLWQIDNGNCLRILKGHETFVRCIKFDSNYIVSGAYDGQIKVWDLKAALNPHSSTNSLCLLTLNHHTGRVFRVQFDEFQIVSSSQDDTILVWDFLSAGTDQVLRSNDFNSEEALFQEMVEDMLNDSRILEYLPSDEEMEQVNETGHDGSH